MIDTEKTCAFRVHFGNQALESAFPGQISILHFLRPDPSFSPHAIHRIRRKTGNRSIAHAPGINKKSAGSSNLILTDRTRMRNQHRY